MIILFRFSRLFTNDFKIKRTVVQYFKHFLLNFGSQMKRSLDKLNYCINLFVHYEYIFVESQP